MDKDTKALSKGALRMGLASGASSSNPSERVQSSVKGYVIEGDLLAPPKGIGLGSSAAASASAWPWQSGSGVDAVSLIEVMEHIPEQVVKESLAAAVLGSIRPRVAVFTTPNYDLNQHIPSAHLHGPALYGPDKPRVRHLDHRFEWTAAQFRGWADQAAR